MFCSDLPPNFAADLKKILKPLVKVPVVVFSAKEQIEYCRPLIPESCVSLDKWFQGEFNLNISRIFNFETQERVGHYIENLEEFQKYVDKVDFVNIVDDDWATGSTIQKVLQYVNKPFRLFSLDNLFGFKYKYDIIDVRDFIPGAKHGGLMFEGQIRLPYINPLVDLTQRMKLSAESAIIFSQKLYELWGSYNLHGNWSLLYKRDILPRMPELLKGD